MWGEFGGDLGASPFGHFLGQPHGLILVTFNKAPHGAPDLWAIDKVSFTSRNLNKIVQFEFKTMGSLGVEHHKVIIVGCGPVGLTTATNLARAGVPVLILERNQEVDQSPRASAYQPCAQAELLETGTLDDVKAESVINDRLSFWVNKERVAYVDKREGGEIFPAGINCPQPQLAAILLRHLTTKYNSEVRFNQQVIEVTEDEASNIVTVTALNPATNEHTRYTCDWLIGADGAGSSVRKLCNIAFEGFSWPKEDFVATNIKYDFYKHGFTTANFVLDPVHWAVVTILGAEKDLWRIAFGLRAGLTNEEIRAELDEHYKHIFPIWPVEYELVQLNKYKPHQRCAETFRKGRVMLAGDAAHVSDIVPAHVMSSKD